MAHTHGAADLAGAFRGSLTENGNTIFPNGLTLQWLTGFEDKENWAASTQYMLPITFPHICFAALVTCLTKITRIRSCTATL